MSDKVISTLLMTVLITAVFERAGDFCINFLPMMGWSWLGLQVKIYLGALENGHINQVVLKKTQWSYNPGTTILGIHIIKLIRERKDLMYAWWIQVTLNWTDFSGYQFMLQYRSVTTQSISMQVLL